MLRYIQKYPQHFHIKPTYLFLGGCASYFLYKAGQQRYKQAQFSYLYENMNYNVTHNQDIIKRPKQKVKGFIYIIYHYLKMQLRVLELMIIFAPLCLFFPFAYLSKKYLFPYWVDLLILTLEYAGPLWMKLGQWASHRSDFFGYQITQGLSRLRDSATPHKYKDTYKQFQQEFHKSIEEVFDSFEAEPYASGSIGQVHVAMKDGVKYAVKVRHPHMIEKLEIDLKILYTVSNILSTTGGIFGRLAMPVTFHEFSSTLMNQADFRFEARNLEILQENFYGSRNVIFPTVLQPYVSKSVLVETFEEGESLTDFMKKPLTREHKITANLGLKAFYKMLIYDNFIHADLHAGNILVRISDNKKSLIHQAFDNIEETFYDLVEKISDLVIPYIEERFLHKPINVLQNEKKTDELNFWEYLREHSNHPTRVDLVFIDPGMVTILNQQDRINFIKIIMYVALRKPSECGQLMLSLAQYEKKIKPEKEKKFLQDIEDLFSELCSVPLAKMNLAIIFRGMLDILRNNELAIEGHFATLLTNMMILEGIGRALDPEINVVSKAASFLLQVRTIDSTINQLMSATI